MMHSPMEIANHFVDIGENKAKLSAWRMLLLGIFAGAFVAFAGAAGTASSATVDNAAVGKLIGACVFPAGIAMVLIAGSELFTGNNLMIISVLQKRITVWQMLKNWFFVFLGNFIGAAFVAVMVVYGHTPDLFGGELANKIVASGTFRVEETFTEAFIRGILCNILVCISVWAALAAKTVIGKLSISFWPVMLFVMCGFEHSVADVYFCIAAMLTASEYGISPENLNWFTFLFKNLLPVLLGNIVGGAGFVGTGYWLAYLYHSPRTKKSRECEEKELDIAEEY